MENTNNKVKKIAMENDIKVIKNQLKNILLKNCNQDKVLDIMLDAITRINKIVIHTYQFLKLYLLAFNNGIIKNSQEYPRINASFIKSIMKTISVKKNGKARRYKTGISDTIKDLFNFNENTYKKLRVDGDEVSDIHIAQILNYEADAIITNIENNITQHYTKHLKTLVNVKFELKNKLAEANKEKNKVARKILVSGIYAELKNIKDDLMNVKNENLISTKEEHLAWIKKFKYKLIPPKEKFLKDSIDYDVCAHPMDYIDGMLTLNRLLSSCGTTDNPVKLFHALPLRTNIVLKYITFDTCSLIILFAPIIMPYLSNIIEKENETKLEADKEKIITNSIILINNITLHKENIWKSLFNLDSPFFKKKGKKGYKFHGMIKTDGIACSVLFSKKIPKRNKKDKVVPQYPYIESYTHDQIKEILKDMNYALNDPNYGNLCFFMGKNCLTETGEKNEAGSKFRYTQNQRRKETKSKTYSKIRDGINKELTIDVPIWLGGERVFQKKSAKELEVELSNYNSKTCWMGPFMAYIRIKNKLNHLLHDHYKKPIFRKLKWNSYTNTQRSESKMVNKFKEKFGPPETTVIITGDYDNKGSHMKGKEPIIGKRVRTLFHRAGYPIYLINEFRTSKTCNKCSHDVENFKTSPSKKPKKLGKDSLVWGLVRCTNVNCKPSTTPKGPISEQNTHTSIYQRDMNACMNMLKIVKSLLSGTGRPAIYCRRPLVPV